MQELIDSIKNFDLVALLAIIATFNTALYALGAFLDKIKDKTATDLDNKLSSVINSVASFLKKLVDMFSANKEHKEEVKPIPTIELKK